MSMLVPVRRSFPRAALIAIPRRGLGGILSVFSAGGSLSEAPEAATGQPWYVPDLIYNWQGKAAPDQVYLAEHPNDPQTLLEQAQATINPVTGQVVPAALAYQQSTQNLPAQALQQAYAQPTGSPIADTVSSLLSSVVGTGSNTANPSGTPTWQIALFVLAIGAGGYLLYKAL